MAAQIIDKVQRNGRTIAIYDNGMERDMDDGHFMRPPTAALITKETAQVMKRKRQEKAARLLREKIRAATESVSDIPINDSAEAIAEAGGILWSEIVLDRDAYHRDRLEAFTKLGQLAGAIPNISERGEAEKTDVATAVLNASAALVRAMAEAMRPAEVVEGSVTTTRSNEE